jgi:WD40 repeat protein
MDGHKNRIHAIRSHPAMDTVFLTGGWDETIHYWDERTQHSQKHFAGPHLCGDALDIIAEHQVILTGSWRKNSTLQVGIKQKRRFRFFS